MREQREGILSSCVKLNLNSPDSVEIAGLSGFSAVWICMEHGSASWNDISHLVRAGKIHDVDVIVRVSKGSYSDYVKAFECDAAAIMVPHVTSAKEAAAVVEICRFQPLGKRPLDGGNADGAYCVAAQRDYLANGNQEKFIALQIESPEGLEAVEEIAAVEGYEALTFGPGDFTHRIGKLAGDSAPELLAARERVEAATKRFGKFGFGVGVQGTPEQIKERGYGILNLSSDVQALESSWRAAIDGFQKGSIDAGYYRAAAGQTHQKT
jgi:4-hydroxy-2-oxoheptanedioate aldolase